ncbi:MFS transporter [Lichenihabitans psoromatis]|uniref:MFS transporter n=1 Tax=Lichenihabitans psoromatis TaxID=2528642 RepID=UPI0010362B51|nr:MFS transporter [Lichenihabitans psoromatis]
MPSRLLTPLIIACALFMENLDSTVLATSLPAIAIDLHEDPIALKLALTSYLLSLAIFIPASGWAADRFGARTIFRGAIVVFTLGSILCGFSSTLPQFIAARIFQGLGGAMMVPVGRLVLLRSVPRNEIVQALAYLTMPALIGPILGPPLGGFITTYSDWRWIFWINVPIGILGVTLATLFIDDVKEAEPPRLDVPGFLLTGFGLSGLMFGMSVAGRGSLPPLVTAGLIGSGVILLGLYLRHARRTAYPIIDLALLRVPTFAASLYGGFLFRLGIGALPFLLPLLLQLGFGLSPFQSGCLTFGAAAGAFLMKTTAHPILRRFGFRRVLIFNAIVSSLFLALYGLFTASTPWWMMFALLLGGGFFRSLEFTSINAIAYADIDNAAMSRATSFASVVQQLSLSTGVTVGAAVIEFSRRIHGDSTLRTEDFGAAFFLIALISAASALIFMRLPPSAAAALTQRGARPAPAIASAATPAGRDG